MAPISIDRFIELELQPHLSDVRRVAWTSLAGNGERNCPDGLDLATVNRLRQEWLEANGVAGRAGGIIVFLASEQRLLMRGYQFDDGNYQRMSKRALRWYYEPAIDGPDVLIE